MCSRLHAQPPHLFVKRSTEATIELNSPAAPMLHALAGLGPLTSPLRQHACSYLNTGLQVNVLHTVMITHQRIFVALILS